MPEELLIRTLTPADFPELYRVFLASFANYQVPMQPSQDQLRIRFKRISINYRLSAGAFDNGVMVGFILTGRGGFDGEPTAYNGGTGILPEYRKLGLAKAIYQHLFPLYKKHGIGQCLLEVLTDNAAAVQLYEGLGFSKSRLLRCYAANGLWHPAQNLIGQGIRISKASVIDWEQYELLADVRPSWQNNAAAVSQSFYSEVALEAYYHTALVGYATFRPEDGRISQIAVEDGMRGQGVGSMLLLTMQEMAHKRLSILNIDDNYRDTCQFFSNRGFINLINQWEMVLKL